MLTFRILKAAILQFECKICCSFSHNLNQLTIKPLINNTENTKTMTKSKAMLISTLLAFTIAPVSAAVNKSVSVQSQGVAHAFGLDANHGATAEQTEFYVVGGQTKTKMTLTYKGVSIWGEHIVAQKNAKGDVFAARGNVKSFCGVDIHAKISKGQAVKALKDKINYSTASCLA
jgi:Zn-dependent metalloprotease